MSARPVKSSLAGKPNLKKKVRLESYQALKPSSLASKSKSKTQSKAGLDAPALSKQAKGKERASTPVASPKRLRKTAPKIQEPSSSTSLPTSFKVVVGSYEKLLYGLEGTVSVDSSEYSFDLKPIFIFPAHVSCIKTVAASPQGGKWLATGSADEIVKVWDLRRRKEIGGLMQHQGTFCIPARTWITMRTHGD